MASLDISLEPGPEAPSRARDRVAAMDPDVDVETMSNVKLIVSELVTNSIRHGGLASGDQIGVKVETRDKTIRLEVTDPGRGFTHKRRTPASLQGGGWGLYLIERLAARWGIDRKGGTRVWCELTRAQRLPRLRSTAASN